MHGLAGSIIDCDKGWQLIEVLMSVIRTHAYGASFHYSCNSMVHVAGVESTNPNRLTRIELSLVCDIK